MGFGGALIWTGLIKNLKIKYPEKNIVLIYKNSLKQLVLNKNNFDLNIYKNNKNIYMIIDNIKWFFLKNVLLKKNIIPLKLYDNNYNYCYKDTKEKIFYKTKKHAIQITCDVHNLSNIVLKPEIFLTENEKRNAEIITSKYKLIKDKYICIEPNIKKSFTPNKMWFWDRWQKLVSLLNDYFKNTNLNIKIVQIGIKTNDILNNVINLTGKLSFRENAYILKNSLTFISYMGGLIHLSKAMDKRNIVLISAWEPKELASYPDDINFYSNIECRNCGLKIPCPIDRECMKRIKVKEVYNSVLKLLKDKI